MKDNLCFSSGTRHGASAETVPVETIRAIILVEAKRPPEDEKQFGN